MERHDSRRNWISPWPEVKKMQIETGDTVQLTATVMLSLADQAPEVFKQLQDARRTGGQVIDIQGNKVFVDMGDALRGPLAIEVDGANPHLALQLIKKAESEDVAEPYEADPAPPAQAAPDVPQGLFPWAYNAMRPPMFPQPQSQPRDEAPSRVRLSQWVMVQFLQLKQYGIAQDLTRVDDEHAPLPEPGSEAERWKAEGKNLRAVMVELSAEEEQLYNSALAQIRGWITDAAVTQHPEVAPSPEVESAPVVADVGDDLEEQTSPEPEEEHEPSADGED